MKKATPAYKHEMEIGRRIVSALPQFKTQQETATELGITRQAVDRIEKRALVKVQKRLRELLLNEEEMVCNSR